MTKPDLGAVFDAAHAESAILSPSLWEPLDDDMVERVRIRFATLLVERGVDTLNATTLIGTGCRGE